MALIACPECGKQISGNAAFCIHCGYPLGNMKEKKFDASSISESVPEAAASAIQLSDSASSSIPVHPQDTSETKSCSCAEDTLTSPRPAVDERTVSKRSLSGKATAAIICVAIILLVVFCIPMLTRPQSAPSQNMLEHLTLIHWYLVNDEVRNRTTYVIGFDGNGRPESVSVTDLNGKTDDFTFTYVLDANGNPTAVNIPGQLFGTTGSVLFAMNNQYKGDKLVRVEITSDKDKTENFLSGFNWMFIYQVAYRDALIVCGEDELQLRNGLTVREKTSNDDFECESTYEYLGYRLLSVMTRYLKPSTSEYSVNDERGLLKSASFTHGDVTATAAITYEEAVDPNGRACLMAKLDLDRSANLSDEMIESFDENRLGYYIMNSQGNVIEHIREGSSDFSTVQKYDDLGRTISLVWTHHSNSIDPSSDSSIINTYTNYTDTYYEYR